MNHFNVQRSAVADYRASEAISVWPSCRASLPALHSKPRWCSCSKEYQVANTLNIYWVGEV